MKRFFLAAAFILMALGTVSAQTRGSWPSPEQPITVEGTLQFQNGQIVLNSGTEVYFIPSINRLIGFIDGLREGARVSVEGYAYGNIIHSTKLTVSGRVYDFPDPVTRQGFPENAPVWGRHHNQGPMGRFRQENPGSTPQRQPRDR